MTQPHPVGFPQPIARSNRSLQHVFTHILLLGGVQSMIRRHLERPVGDGLTHEALLLFERPPFPGTPAPERLSGLGIQWYHSGRVLRRRYAARQGPAPRLSLYHNLWGIGTLADLDPAPRRLAMFHSPWVGSEIVFRAASGLLDGVLCVSAPLLQTARACLPDLAAERFALLPIPVDPPSDLGPPASRSSKELVLGFSGRVASDPKRVERLPEIARHLASQGVRQSWEVLGDGPQLAELQKGFEEAGISVVCHGKQSGAGYWRPLSTWDAIVFASDFEGLPLTLLEALTQGVLPIFPRLTSGGRDYTERIAPELVYEPGDAASAARSLQWLSARSAEERARLKLRAQEVVRAHHDGTYDRRFAEFVGQIQEAPRVSAEGRAARRRYWAEWLPYGLVNRLAPDHPLRRGYL